ncbi:MAG: hypothetical protein KDB23_09240 [Planctomycetales bacterium]|nr:hypothetical protein [Planctomycetales bacterium]
MIDVPLVIPNAELHHAPRALIGGKAHQLFQVRSFASIPTSFVVTTAALPRLLHEYVGLSGEETLPKMRDHLSHVALPDDWIQQIRNEAEPLFAAGKRLAVRSSAVSEDGQSLSFAGIHTSVLGVDNLNDLLSALRQVWLSALSPRAISYRKQHGLLAVSLEMAVLVQELIPTESAGVCFTCDPTTASDQQIVIHSVWGLGEGLVSHGLAHDIFYVDRHTRTVRQQLGHKTTRLTIGQSGEVQMVDVQADHCAASSLSEHDVQHLAKTAILAETRLGSYQDIEFGVSDGQLYLFQTRPVTATQPAPLSNDSHQVWDNSNIIESYSGTTTPMTFSFIRRAYSIVYRCFAEVMGISAANVEQHRDAFDNMLGIFRGRVYYNLKNWYRLIRLFPGYEYNRTYMEAMMGVKQSMTLADASPPVSSIRRWFVEFPALCLLLARCFLNFIRIRPIVARFDLHFQRHYDEWSRIDFRGMPPQQIAALYDMMEGKMLWNWKAPIINDFYVMVFYGVLKALCRKWCHDTSGTMQNGLVSGSGGLLSEAPARLLMQMTHVADSDSALRRIIITEDVEILPSRIANDERFVEFQCLVQRFLDDFGLRSPSELKLESTSYRDEPQRIYQLIRSYLQTKNPAIWNADKIRERELAVRHQAETQAFAALRSRRRWWFRRRVFQWVLSNARQGIVNRENMRFARTRVYGILRSMLRAMGQTFTEHGVLQSREDIFYLTLDEVWSYVRGTAVSANLQGLVDTRRREYAGYEQDQLAALPNRFETAGLPYVDLINTQSRTASQNLSDTLQGVGCCPGLVSGMTQVVRDPNDVSAFEGQILVAEHTDPGWVALFPAFAGILVERGSVLSHSAIVAREMGIPTIVSVAGLTNRVQSGQHVEMDGRAGTVRLIRTGD